MAVFRAKVISVERVEDTINVIISYTSDFIEVRKHPFNFQIPVTRQTARAEVDRVGQRIKDAMMAGDDLAGIVGNEWVI